MKVLRGKMSFVLLAAGGSLIVNVCVLGLASLLSQERKLRQDMTNPIGISLVNLEAPDIQDQDNMKEPEKPEPQQKDDFTPDLIKPQLSGIDAAIDAGVVVNLGNLAGGDLEEEAIFEAYQLDQAPQPLVRVPPVYPYRAREQGIEGAVQVKLLVNTDGTIGHLQIVQARPPGVFEDAVMKAVPQWKFSPGKIGGNPVTAWVVTTVRFEF
jgi:protein TonB